MRNQTLLCCSHLNFFLQWWIILSGKADLKGKLHIFGMMIHVIKNLYWTNWKQNSGIHGIREMLSLQTLSQCHPTIMGFYQAFSQFQERTKFTSWIFNLEQTHITPFVILKFVFCIFASFVISALWVQANEIWTQSVLFVCQSERQLWSYMSAFLLQILKISSG